MAEPDIAAQAPHMPLLEHVAHETVALAHEELALMLGDDAGRILATMLEHRQRIVNPVIYGRASCDAYDSAHWLIPEGLGQR